MKNFALNLIALFILTVGGLGCQVIDDGYGWDDSGYNRGDDDDDDTAASDDDDTSGNGGGSEWEDTLSLVWEGGANYYALALVANPPNLPSQVFAESYGESRIQADLPITQSVTIEWIVLVFHSQNSYDNWQECRGDNPRNECWQEVDFMSCVGDATQDEDFPIGGHYAWYEDDELDVDIVANPYDGCVAEVTID